MKNITEQVTEFHEAFGYPVRKVPQFCSSEELHLRLRLITEEYFEVLEACGIDLTPLQDVVERTMSGVPYQVDLTKLADALGDLDYVVEGTRLTVGIPRQAVADEIHRSNMAKVGGVPDATGKLQKPEGWTPPDIESILKSALEPLGRAEWWRPR